MFEKINFEEKPKSVEDATKKLIEAIRRIEAKLKEEKKDGSYN